MAVESIAIPPSLAAALHQHQSNRRASISIWRWILLTVAWFTLLFAISQPYRNTADTAQPSSGRAMSVLIDLSTSMERRDFTLAGEPVDRLTVVKHIAGQFIEAREGDRIGLILFGSEAFIASPLSFDLNAVNSTLQSSGIGMAGRTTAIGDALGLAIKSLRDDPAPDKAIVLLSDGTNNSGSAEPEDAARIAATLGIVVHTIGLGSDASVNASQQFQSAAADLDEATLKAIAETSGGRFFRAQTTAELENIYREIDTLQSAEVQAPALIVRQDFRNLFILVFLCSLLLLTVHSRPWMRAE
jgi:Ca-activated chloride channel family protein